MMLWLSKDLGFSDQAAGALVGWVWAPAMTVFTLLAGSLTDAIGLASNFFPRRGDLHSGAQRDGRDDESSGSRWRAAFFRWPSVRRSGTPVLLAATRRYSTTAQRSISFSIIYMVMNVGYIAAGWIFDYVRHSFEYAHQHRRL